MQQTLIKSIIYGNIVPTSYGMLRALCSAITSKDHIDKIILYLRNNHNFLKYNKFVYSFRLQHITSELFITQEQQQYNNNNFINKPKFLQGYNDDNGFQGIGEKLLALLQKFNVRNVLIILAIRQKDPLKNIYSHDNVQMVKSAKELLSSLYDKVVNSKTYEEKNYNQNNNHNNNNDQIGFKQAIETKQFKMPLEQQYKKVQKLQANPNYVGQQFIKRSKKQTIIDSYKSQITFLNNKIKNLAQILQQIIQRFGQTQDSQLKFTFKYDKSKLIQKVFLLLSLLFQFPNPSLLLQQNISLHLKSITSRNLTSSLIRKLNEQLMCDKNLKSEIIVQKNQICGMLMEFIEVLLKSYGFAKKLAIKQAEIEEIQKNMGNQYINQNQKNITKSNNSEKKYMLTRVGK